MAAMDDFEAAIYSMSGRAVSGGRVAQAFLANAIRGVLGERASASSVDAGQPAYGLRDFGVEDNYSSIMAAHAATKVGGILELPPGNFSVHKPLLLDLTQRTLRGAGKLQTTIRNSTGFDGPQVCIGPTEPSIPTTTISGVVCMDFTALGTSNGTPGNAYLNLRECYDMEWGGRTNFCWEYKFRTGTVEASTRHINSAQGKRFTTVGVEVCFVLQITSSKFVQAHVLIDGVTKVVTSTTALADNTDYEIRIDYDGSNLAILLNGTREQQVAATGPLTLYRHAVMALGPAYVEWPWPQGIYTDPAKIRLRSCRFGATRGQTNYSATPLVPYTRDGTTHLCLNFDTTHGPFTVAEATGGIKVYLQAIRPTQGTEVVGAHLEDIQFAAGRGGALHTFRSRFMRVRNLYISSGRYGVLLRDNCFNSEVWDITYESGQAHPFFGVANLASSGPNYIGNLNINCETYGLVHAASSMGVHGTNYIIGCRNFAVFSRAQTVLDTLDMFNVKCADEGMAVAPEGGIGLDGPAAFTSHGCSLDYPSHDASPIWVDSRQSVEMKGLGVQLKSGGSKPLVTIVGGSAANEVRLTDAKVTNESGHARALTPAGGAALGHVTRDSDNAKGKATVLDGDTVVAVTFAVAQPDDDYVPTLTPGANVNAWWSDPATSGFNINISSAAGEDGVPVAWKVER